MSRLRTTCEPWVSGEGSAFTVDVIGSGGRGMKRVSGHGSGKERTVAKVFRGGK